MTPGRLPGVRDHGSLRGTRLQDLLLDRLQVHPLPADLGLAVEAPAEEEAVRRTADEVARAEVLLPVHFRERPRGVFLHPDLDKHGRECRRNYMYIYTVE